jgi:hypothetical protein
VAHRIDIVDAAIAIPADKGLLADVGLDLTGVDRIDQCEAD